MPLTLAQQARIAKKKQDALDRKLVAAMRAEIDKEKEEQRLRQAQEQQAFQQAEAARQRMEQAAAAERARQEQIYRQQAAHEAALHLPDLL